MAHFCFVQTVLFEPQREKNVALQSKFEYSLVGKPANMTFLDAAHNDPKSVSYQNNMSVSFIPTCTPLLYSNTGIYRGIHICLNFWSKTYIDRGYSLEPPE